MFHIFFVNIYSFFSLHLGKIFLKCFYYYSLIDIYFSNNLFIKQFKNEFNEIFFNEDLDKELPYIELIKNGNIIKKINLHNHFYSLSSTMLNHSDISFYLNNLIENFHEIDFDFYIYSYKYSSDKSHNKTKQIFKKIILSKSMIIPSNLENIKNHFINFTIEMKVKKIPFLFFYNKEEEEKLKFKIILENENFNFNIEDNCFDLNFFNYYIKNILNYNLILKDDTIMNVNLIDDNININNFQLSYNKNKRIIIKKDKYLIS